MNVNPLFDSLFFWRKKPAAMMKIMRITSILILTGCLQVSAKKPQLKISFYEKNVPPVEINGIVTGEKAKPLAGASVKIKGTNKGTFTDASGKFTLQLEDSKGILVVSYVGYEVQEVKANQTGLGLLNIVLKLADSKIGDVVVMGYVTQKKATLTGSVTTIKGTEIAQNSSGNISNALAGRLPGLIANNRSGQPGDDGSNLLIRGLNSFGGGTAPLVVVDGIPDRDISRINADDIESVTILKDASAAIYGVRSANGVILITTKRGTTSKPAIEYNGSAGIQQLTRLDSRLNAWQYMTYYNELNINQGNTAPYAQSNIAKYRLGTDPDYTSTDWFKTVFRPNAPQSNHSITVRGGTDNVKYFISGQYLDQQSNYRHSDEDYKQFNIRSNLDIKVTASLKVNVDLSTRKETRVYPTSNPGSILHEVVSMYPFLPDYWANGYPGAGIANGRNPVVLTSSAPGYDKITNLIVNPKLGFDLQLPYIAKGLSLNGYAAFDFNNRSEKKFSKQWDAYTYDSTTKIYVNQKANTGIPSISQDEQLSNNNTYFLKLAYNHQFGKHAINAFAAYEQTNYNYKSNYAYRQNLLSDQLDQLFTGSTVDQNATGSAAQNGRESYFGSVGYAYNNKYLLDVSLRYNGSFNFPADKRWGLFPAVSAGWRISEEKFFKDNIRFVDQLKIRGSWGLMGSDAVAQYQFITRYQIVSYRPNYTYFGDYTEAISLSPSATPNPNITWEKQDSKNVGLDASLFDSRLTITADAFRFIRKDILAQRSASVPLFTGLLLPQENIGRCLNEGVDFSINYAERKSVIKYNIGVNFTYTKSKILFRDEAANTPAWQKSTGYAIDSWLVYQANGIYRTQTQVNNSPHLNGAAPGDLWIKDVDEDGSITTKDMVRIPESSTPKQVYGITMGAAYKGIALNLLWSGQAQAKQLILPQAEGSLANPPQWLYDGRWTPANTDAIYPRAFNANDIRNSVAADFWLRDASFLRLKSAELSYTLPANVLSKIKFSNVRFYISGFNIFSFDKFRQYNLDPETNNITGINYPQTRIYRVGINVGL